MIATWTKIKVARSLFVIYFVSPVIVGADCIGPPSLPVLTIDIQGCEVANQFDSTLRITGDARQVLTLYFPHATRSDHIEFALADKVVFDRSFWVSIAPGKGCEEFLEEPEEIWLLGDICNDTGQNIPDIQIMRLWPEIKQDAMKHLAMRTSGDT